MNGDNHRVPSTIDRRPPIPSAGAVEEAAARIADGIVRTPSAFSKTLSDISGAQVIVKFENLQFTASYKERGALNKLLLLRERHGDQVDRAGVVAMSAGNHAQGLAYHGARLGIPTTIVMPEHTPNIKVSRTRQLGAEVILYGRHLADAGLHSAELAATTGATLVPPYDDADVLAGQGTVARELLADHPEIDTLVVPVGGGGLISGMAVATKGDRPDIEIVGVQAEAFPSMVESFHSRTISAGGGVTIAEGIAVASPGEITAPIVRRLVDDMVLVNEATIEEAICLYLEVEKTVVEGAGAAGLAALLADPARYRGRTVGLVISGGNIDLRLLASVVMRGLARSGRLASITLQLSDRPGALAEVATLAGDLGANIIEVVHQRDFSALSARDTELQLAVETRDAAHARQLVDALTARGLRVVRTSIEA